MEVAQCGGERAPGALEDGGNASRAPESPNDGSEGPQDLRTGHGPHGIGSWDGSRSHGTPSCTGPGADEGTEGPQRTGTDDEGARRTEGPGDDSRSHGTPSRTGADEGPQRTGTDDEGARRAEEPRRFDEGPGDDSRSHGTPSRTGADEGPQRTRTDDEGARRAEEPRRIHEGPGNDSRSDGTPSHTGTGADEGPGDSYRSHGTPRHARTGSDEEPRHARTGADEVPEHTEGPRRTLCTNEGPGDNSRSHGTPSRTRPSPDEGPRHARSGADEETGHYEGPRRTVCTNEGPGDSSRSHETPSHTGPSTDEGPRHTRTGADEGPRCTRTGADEGPRRTVCTNEGLGNSSRSHGTPSRTRTNPDEGPRHTRTGADEGPRRTVCTNEGPGDSSRGHETPSRTRTGADEGTVCPDEEHEVSGADGDPDVSRDIIAKQRNAGARVAEGPRDPGTCREGHAPGTSATKELSEDGASEEWHPEPGGDPGSFKKPVAPGRPADHEKALDPRNEPRPPVPDGEAAPNVCPGLPVPYREPPWSGRPQALYSLEVLKGGAILSTKDLSQAGWTVFGRLPVCHVPLEHPSVSRFHAVLQYRSTAGDEPDQERGFYVYDLGSTHGTFVNKQRIPPKTYSRIRVGHVMKFGGSTRLFILQGPEEDQEAECELTVTQIKEARRQKEDLQKRMLGDDSDEEEEPSEEGKKPQASAGEEAGCMWGMGEDAIEEENEENPIAMEFQEEREASYIKNPKKALQGFFDREGEELEFEYEERSPGSWLCRIKLPADDSAGKQLVAEVTHSGKKKEAANLCSLEACRMLEMRGLLRQEAVSRKRKAKKWEDEDFYDSDDDTFLDRTGIVEKKRLNRMKKAGKIEEKPETLETLSDKLELVEKEMADVAAKLKTSHTGVTQPSTQDSLDAFMTEIKAGSSMDSVSRRKLHLQSLELKKEQQRLKSLIKIVRPAKLPELRANPATEDSKPKKLNLPMFGAMKGGSKFKLKTGTVGRLPPKRTALPASLFTMKDDDEPEEEEEEEEDDDDEQMKVEDAGDGCSEDRSAVAETAKNIKKIDPAPEIQKTSTGEMPKPAAERQKKMHGPSKPPRGVLSTQYPEDDPDYCVWTPPAGQSGDGKTHLNEKYGY